MSATDVAVHDFRQETPMAVASWMADVPWQLFATLEFPWIIRPETAGNKFNELVDTLGRTLRTRICYLRVGESKAKSGAAVLFHYHAVFTALKMIPSQLVAGVWNALVGRANDADSDLALVEPYDSARCGIKYMAKHIADETCVWDWRNVHLFSNTIQFTQKDDHDSRRSLLRFQAQKEQLGVEFDAAISRAA